MGDKDGFLDEAERSDRSGRAFSLQLKSYCVFTQRASNGGAWLVLFLFPLLLLLLLMYP